MISRNFWIGHYGGNREFPAALCGETKYLFGTQARTGITCRCDLRHFEV